MLIYIILYIILGIAHGIAYDYYAYAKMESGHWHTDKETITTISILAGIFWPINLLIMIFQKIFYLLER